MLTTVPAEVAVTPKADNLVSALIADFKAVAIVLSVSVDNTVYVTDS